MKTYKNVGFRCLHPLFLTKKGNFENLQNTNLQKCKFLKIFARFSLFVMPLCYLYKR